MLFCQEDEHVFVSSLVGQSYKAKSIILAIPPHLAGEHIDPGGVGEGRGEILPGKLGGGVWPTFRHPHPL